MVDNVVKEMKVNSAQYGEVQKEIATWTVDLKKIFNFEKRLKRNDKMINWC